MAESIDHQPSWMRRHSPDWCNYEGFLNCSQPRSSVYRTRSSTVMLQNEKKKVTGSNISAVPVSSHSVSKDSASTHLLCDCSPQARVRSDGQDLSITFPYRESDSAERHGVRCSSAVAYTCWAGLGKRRIYEFNFVLAQVTCGVEGWKRC